MTKRKISIRMICLIVAATILTGTLTVSAFNGSAYETVKNAIIDTLMLDNYTIEGMAVIIVDGEVYEKEPLFAILGNGRELDIQDDDYFTFITNLADQRYRLTVRTEGSVDNEIWYSMSTRRENRNASPVGSAIISPTERYSTEFRLIELAIDLVIGDLKNNFIMTNQGNGIRRIQGAVTGHQLPEIVRVFIDREIEEDINNNRRWREGDFGQREDYSSVLDMPLRSLTIDLLQGVADVDSDGFISYLNVGATATMTNVFNDTHVVEVNFFVRFTEIDTSNPQIPIPGAEELFTEEFLQGLFDGANRVFFTRGGDGYIDLDSFTTTRPTGLLRETQRPVIRF